MKPKSRFHPCYFKRLPLLLRIRRNTADSTNTQQYLPLSCPSHPLMARFLTEVSCHNNKKTQVMIGMPTYSTNAQNVCLEYPLQEISVLQGEEQREVFSVPTCAFGRECAVSLYMDSIHRIIYIVGSKQETMVSISPGIIQKLLLHMENPHDIKQRVLCAVLKKWKVVDRRM